jgi:hypothetical protein
VAGISLPFRFVFVEHHAFYQGLHASADDLSIGNYRNCDGEDFLFEKSDLTQIPNKKK